MKIERGSQATPALAANIVNEPRLGDMRTTE